MIVDKVYEIDSCDDVELGIKRESKLKFKLCYENECELKAIVFVTPGLGGDADENYREHLAQFVAREFKVLVVSANYHCIGNRPQTGAAFYMDKTDILIMQKMLAKIGMQLTIDTSDTQTTQQIYDLLQFLDKELSNKKSNGVLDDKFLLELSVSLWPTNGEYQNFGIMQAQDLINALLFIQNSHELKNINGGGLKKLPVVMIGTSHGGYISCMASKIAPWLIDGVIENSAYAKYPWRFIGFGKEIDYKKYFGCGGRGTFKNIMVYFSDRTHWTINKNSPYFFTQGHEEIRLFLNLDHLKTQSLHKKPIYVSYHCTNDDVLAPHQDKEQLYEILKELGFDATLTMIKDESQIDGKFIKSIEHGMGMSNKLLISKELPKMLEKLSHSVKECQPKNISYASGDLIYKFYEANGRINLEILNFGELGK